MIKRGQCSLPCSRSFSNRPADGLESRSGNPWQVASRRPGDATHPRRSHPHQRCRQHTRTKSAAKRGDRRHVDPESDYLAGTPCDDGIEALDEALSRLAVEGRKGRKDRKCAERFGSGQSS